MYKTEFHNLENWSAMDLTTPSESLPPKPKLKFYCGIFDDEASYYKFCQAHPNLGHLRIESGGGELLPPFASVAVCKLQKLESFNCGRQYISKEFVEGMAEAYPILKILRLMTYFATLPADGKAFFSAFRFPHLTSLSLCNLQLLDGSALISIINGCPKLEIVHLETDTLDSSSYASNLERSIRSATKLRDFRLKWNHKEDVYPETAFSILKVILKESIKKSMEETKLERLTLIDAGTVDLPDWKHPPEFADFLVRFTAQMTHLTCCCLTFKQMDIDLMKAIKERVEEEVVMERPSLWFYLGRDIPDACDPEIQIAVTCILFVVMKKYFVVRLEYLAFIASYKEIKSSLLLCREHRPEGKPHALVSFSSLLSRDPLISSQTVLNFLKCCLDHHLRGTISSEVRKKFVQKFYESTWEYFHGDTIDVWAFLDSVLDESFQELETYVSAPESEPSRKLGPTIAKRSSQLQKLKLNFSHMKRNTHKDKLEPLILNLSSLKNLTSLSLYELDSSHRSVLKFVGKSCPSLSHLSLPTNPKSESNNCHTTGLDVLSLIFGELIDFLLPDKNEKPAWITDGALQQLLVPLKYRTPICFSLRQLELGEGANISDATAAFAIRSIPLLQMIDVSMSSAITILHKTRKLEAKEMQATFEKSCHEAAVRQGFIPQPMKNPPKLSSYLALTSIRGIPVQSVKLIELVRHMCPSLEEAAFFDTSFGFKEKTKATPHLIQSALEKWPKLKTVKINDMSQKFVKSILNAFGPHLQHLEFNECHKLNLADLVVCPVLESLHITKWNTLDGKQYGFSFRTSEFLPQLKSVESGICLSGWSRFFEGITTLTRIVLYCCHIETGSSSHSDWSNVPNMWPLVEELDVKQCAGLTVGMLANQIIPRLSKLKKIAVPGRIRYKERNRQLSFDIVEKFTDRFLSMQERYESVFLEDIRHNVCRVLKPKNKKATTSDYNTYSYGNNHDTSDEEAYNRYYRFATTSEEDSNSSDGSESDY